MNKMYIVLGDWSEDGHGIYKKRIIHSSVGVTDVQNAYKASCKLTGVSFNNNDDFTEVQRNFDDCLKYQICVEYQDNGLSQEAFEVLAKFGLTKKLLNSFDTEDIIDVGEEFYLYEESYINLWIWFVKLSLPKDTVIKLESEKEEIPTINGSGNKNLNVQFGYGLYF